MLELSLFTEGFGERSRFEFTTRVRRRCHHSLMKRMLRVKGFTAPFHLRCVAGLY